VSEWTERLRALRDALVETMQEPEFVEHVRRHRVTLSAKQGLGEPKHASDFKGPAWAAPRSPLHPSASADSHLLRALGMKAGAATGREKRRRTRRGRRRRGRERGRGVTG